MKLEDQVCSLKLSKKLKELGVEQKSNWYWVHHTAFTFEQKPKLAEGWNLIYKDKMSPYREMVFSTFTVAELGEMLPIDIVSGLTSNSSVGGYGCLDLIEFGSAACHHKSEMMKKPEFIAKTEANARAKMLIYLLENNLYEKA